jgi:hypothetical protein
LSENITRTRESLEFITTSPEIATLVTGVLPIFDESETLLSDANLLPTENVLTAVCGENKPEATWVEEAVLVEEVDAVDSTTILGGIGGVFSEGIAVLDTEGTTVDSADLTGTLVGADGTWMDAEPFTMHTTFCVALSSQTTSDRDWSVTVTL